MAELMVQEHNSNALQIQVIGRLDALRLDAFIAKEEITDMPDGLKKLVQVIQDLALQVSPSYRSDEQIMNFLRNAVEFYSWW